MRPFFPALQPRHNTVPGAAPLVTANGSGAVTAPGSLSGQGRKLISTIGSTTSAMLVGVSARKSGQSPTLCNGHASTTAIGNKRTGASLTLTAGYVTTSIGHKSTVGFAVGTSASTIVTTTVKRSAAPVLITSVVTVTVVHRWTRTNTAYIVSATGTTAVGDKEARSFARVSSATRSDAKAFKAIGWHAWVTSDAAITASVIAIPVASTVHRLVLTVTSTRNGLHLTVDATDPLEVTTYPARSLMATTD